MGYRCFRQEHGQDYHRTYGWCHYSAKHTKRIISILWSTIHSFYKHDRVWCTHKRKARHFLYLYLCYRLNAQSLLRLRRGVVSLLCKTCVWSYVYVYIIMLINCRFHLLDRKKIFAHLMWMRSLLSLSLVENLTFAFGALQNYRGLLDLLLVTTTNSTNHYQINYIIEQQLTIIKPDLLSWQ